MTWRELLFQTLAGLVEIIAALLRALGRALVLLVRVWEVPAFLTMGLVVGWCIAELLGLAPGKFRNLFQLYSGFLLMVVGARLASTGLGRKNE